jgi:hypothetical protein
MRAGVSWPRLHELKVMREFVQPLLRLLCALLLLNPRPRLVERALILVHGIASLEKMVLSNADNDERYQQTCRSY